MSTLTPSTDDRSLDDPDVGFTDGRGVEHRLYVLGRGEALTTRHGYVYQGPCAVVRATEERRDNFSSAPLRDRVLWGWMTRLVCEGADRKPLVATDDELLRSEPGEEKP